MKGERDTDREPIDALARPVEAALIRAGEDYRRAAERNALSAESMGRIREAVLSAARSRRGPTWIGRIVSAEWLARPVPRWAYGLAAASAVVICITLSYAARNPEFRILYTAGGIEGIGGDSESLAQGSSVVVRHYPGAVIEIGDAARIYVRDDSAIEVVSRNVVALKTGEIWVSQTGNGPRLKILTPNGVLIPEGKAFGVKAGFATAGKLDVAVLDGTVRLASSKESTAVPHGNRLIWAHSGGEPQIAPAAVRAPRWTEELQAAARKTL